MKLKLISLKFVIGLGKKLRFRAKANRYVICIMEEEQSITYLYVAFFMPWSAVCQQGKKPNIQPLFQCHSKDPLRQKSSITLLSIQYGIYTLHDSSSLCCSSPAVNMGNLTSILQVHRSAKVQYIVQNGLGQQKKSNSSLHCAPTKCCFASFQ